MAHSVVCALPGLVADDAMRDGCAVMRVRLFVFCFLFSVSVFCLVSSVLCLLFSALLLFSSHCSPLFDIAGVSGMERANTWGLGSHAGPVRCRCG